MLFISHNLGVDRAHVRPRRRAVRRRAGRGGHGRRRSSATRATRTPSGSCAASRAAGRARTSAVWTRSPGFLPAARRRPAGLRLRRPLRARARDLPDGRAAAPSASRPARVSRCHFHAEAHDAAAHDGRPTRRRARRARRARGAGAARSRTPRKTFRQDGHDVHALAGVTLDGLPRRDARPGRRVRQRQDHARPHPARPDRRPTRAATVELDGQQLAATLGEPDDRARSGRSRSSSRTRTRALNRRFAVRRIARPRAARSCSACAARPARSALRRAGARGALRRAAARTPRPAPALGRPQAARGDRPRVRRRARARRLRRADLGPRRLRAGRDPQPARRPAGASRASPTSSSRTTSASCATSSDRIAVLYLGRLMELGAAEVVFAARTIRTPRRCSRRCPTLEGGERPRIRLEGEIPSAADAAVRLRLPHALPAQARRRSARTRSRRWPRSSRATPCAATSPSRSSAGSRAPGPSDPRVGIHRLNSPGAPRPTTRFRA